MFDPQTYGTRVAALLTPVRLPSLGPGQENEAARAELAALQPADLAPAGRRFVDLEMARGCLAGLWLYHNFLDQSHGISQDMPSSTGSFWHGIMHRREPDPGNAKYWFRRVGNHPVFGHLKTLAAEVAARHPDVSASRFLADPGPWDAMAWVDLCETARRSETRGQSPELVAMCQEIALLEWQGLFDFCWQNALD